MRSHMGIGYLALYFLLALAVASAVIWALQTLGLDPKVTQIGRVVVILFLLFFVFNLFFGFYPLPLPGPSAHYHC